MPALKYLDGGTWKTMTLPTGIHVGTDPPDPAIKQVWMDTDEVVPAPTRVTSLPASPYEGQECFYVASATAGVLWRLRYNAASASAFKWEFVGGSALHSEVITPETCASSAFTDIATVGPQITMPLAGEYDFYGFARVTVASASNNQYVAGLKIGAAGVQTGAAFVVFDNDNNTTATRGFSGGSVLRRQVAAADVCKMVYSTSNIGAIPTFSNRRMNAIPIRVG